MQDDTLLVHKAQKGDPAAFEALMSPHERKIYALCLRMLGNREDALDGAQETMLRVWRAIKSYKKQASFTTWMYRIATNTCLDMLRKRKVRTSVSLDVLTEAGFSPIDASPEANPQDNAEGAARKKALAESILTLPPDMRAALVLRDIQGLSYDEVADILRTPLGTVKSRINRAREKLRGSLQKHRELFDTQRVYMDERREDA